jgi:hypothetical protein
VCEISSLSSKFQFLVLQPAVFAYRLAFSQRVQAAGILGKTRPTGNPVTKRILLSLSAILFLIRIVGGAVLKTEINGRGDPLR